MLTITKKYLAVGGVKMEELFAKYAPWLLIVVLFLLKNRIFITPEQLNKALEDKKNKCKEDCEALYVTKEEMQKERTLLLQEVEQKFLSLAAFREFEKRIDSKFVDTSRRFDKIDDNLEHIKDLLIKQN